MTDLINWLFEGVIVLYSKFLDSVVFAMSGIPVPEFMSGYSLAATMEPLDAEIGYYLQKMAFGTVLSIIGSAYIARFVRRLIPFFGR